MQYIINDRIVSDVADLRFDCDAERVQWMDEQDRIMEDARYQADVVRFAQKLAMPKVTREELQAWVDVEEQEDFDDLLLEQRIDEQQFLEGFRA